MTNEMPIFSLAVDSPTGSRTDGMSLRAYIATAALQGLLSNPRIDYCFADFAPNAVEHADALIKALKRKT